MSKVKNKKKTKMETTKNLSLITISKITSSSVKKSLLKKLNKGELVKVKVKNKILNISKKNNKEVLIEQGKNKKTIKNRI